MATHARDFDTAAGPVKILHVASEAVPWVKTGGLADVVGALCSHLASSGHEVVLALPSYPPLRGAATAPAERVAVRAGGREVNVLLGAGEAGVRLLLVDAPDLFDRDGLYGDAGGDYPDNAARFSVFVQAALAGAERLGLRPDVVHGHDWQAGLVPLFARPGGGHASAPVVFTLHNLAYQGVFPLAATAGAGLPEDAEARTALVQGPNVNFLKAAILTADRVTTVSPTYAREIASPRLGFGLEEWIAGLDPPILGILNGIDTETWDPATDPYLEATYDAGDMSGKASCKAALQRELGLPPEPGAPLIGMVTRLIAQKGLGLIESLGDDLVTGGAQFAFLGTGEPRFEALVADLAARHAAVACRIEFSEALAHRIEAGSDFFLMPSEFEPCGLTQMISQRYGTPPIVHRVGGLVDSVTHASPEALRSGRATGIVFENFDPSGLSRAVDYALELYADRSVLEGIRRAGMERDFSWRRSGMEYEELYRQILMRQRGDV